MSVRGPVKRETPRDRKALLPAPHAAASDAEGGKHGGRQDVHVTAAQWAQDAAEEGDDDELEALGCGAADAESEGPEDGGGTHAGGPVDVQHVKEFSKARSAHYDEWQAVLAARAKAAEEDDEEETAVAAGH